MQSIFELLEKTGIIPVIALDRAEDAVPLADALRRGGVNCAEVTFRTAAAEEAIRLISQAYPDMLLGAGTVLTPEQADRAVAAGASFVVTPGLNRRVVAHCVEREICIIPGCGGPSDIETALEYGLEVVKFFPAEACGGVAAIKALCGPYTTMKFMATGGISAENLCDYLAFDRIIACGGSWIVKKDMIAAGEFDKIAALTEEAVNRMLGFTLAHVGINMENAEKAMDLAQCFRGMLGLPVREGKSSIFSDTAMEIMKKPFLGANGHIGFKTNSVARTVYYLEKRGFAFNWDAASYDEKGRLKIIYMAEDFGGFAIHFVQR